MERGSIMPAIDEQIFQAWVGMDLDNQKEEIFPEKTPRVLIIFFSFSGQTSGL